MPLIYVALAALGIGGFVKVSGDLEGVSENLAKAAPWIAGAAGAYLIAKAVRK